MKRGVLIGILILIILSIVSIIFFYPKIFVQKEILEVELMEANPDGSSSGNAITTPSIEVSLWYADKNSGPPTAGISKTNEKGIATFEVPAGNYFIGFNELNFPKEFVYPKFPYFDKTKMPAEVEPNSAPTVIISIFRK